MQNPKLSCLAATKRIIRYLKGTLDYGIFFPASDEGNECRLVGYTDPSWCEDAKDKKSTTSHVFMLYGAPIT